MYIHGLSLSIHFSLHSHSNKLKLPIRGKAIAPVLRISPPVLDFADVVANDHADQLIMATNTSSKLHVKYKVL